MWAIGPERAPSLSKDMHPAIAIAVSLAGGVFAVRAYLLKQETGERDVALGSGGGARGRHPSGVAARVTAQRAASPHAGRGAAGAGEGGVAGLGADDPDTDPRALELLGQLQRRAVGALDDLPVGEPADLQRGAGGRRYRRGDDRARASTSSDVGCLSNK